MKRIHTFAMAGALAPSLAVVMFLTSCGKVENKDLPPKPGKLTTKDVDKTFAASEKLWNDVAVKLEIGNNKATTSDALKAQLGTPSTLVSDKTKAPLLAASLTASYVPNAMVTRCSKIKSLTELRVADQSIDEAGVATPAAAKLYKMVYNLARADGKNDGIDRSGFVTIPTTNGSFPVSAILLYAHGGTSGLTTTELAKATGGFAANHIVVAPTLPNQPLLSVAADKTVTVLAAADAQNVAPYDGDANELLGMQDCVARASYTASGAVVAGIGLGVDDGAYSALNSTLAGAVLRHKNTTSGATRLSNAAAVSGFFAAVPSTLQTVTAGGAGAAAAATQLSGYLAAVAPVTIVAGSSTGGLVAELAMAKTGAVLSASASSDANVKALIPAAKGYLAPTLFTCAFTAAAPYTITAAKNRLMLEYVIKGTVDNTNFIKIPYVKGMASYVKGKGADEIASYVKSIDGTMNGLLAIAANQNWSKYVATAVVATPTPVYEPGTWFMLHGTTDDAMPYDLMKLGFNIFMSQSTALSTSVPAKAPGVNFLALALPTGHIATPTGFNPEFFTAKTSVPTDLATADLLTGVKTKITAANVTALATATGLDEETVLRRAASGVFKATVNPPVKDFALDKTMGEALLAWRTGDCATAMVSGE